jgi:hypothetical protein
MRLWNNGTLLDGYAKYFLPFPPGGSSSCNTATTSSLTVTQNCRLEIYFTGEGANMGCNTEYIIINIQIIE